MSVPQGLMMDPLLFLENVNYLSEITSYTITLFAHDALVIIPVDKDTYDIRSNETKH